MSNTRRFLPALLCGLLTPTLALAAGQQVSKSKWETRQLPHGGAVALIGGPGSVHTLTLVCKGKTPTAALVLAAGQPNAEAAVASFNFGLIRVDLPLTRDPGPGNIWVSDLSASPLTKLLASQSGKVGIDLNGQPQGALSLQGSAQASRAALAQCPAQ